MEACTTPIPSGVVWCSAYFFYCSTDTIISLSRLSPRLALSPPLPLPPPSQIQLLANIRRGPTPPARECFYPMPEGVTPPGRACNDLLCRLLVPDPQHRASFRDFFDSDVLRPPSASSSPAAPAGAAAATLSGEGSRPSQRSDARRSSFDRGQGGGGQVEASLTAAGGGGGGAGSPVGAGAARQGGEGRHTDRDAAGAYSSSGNRASASQARGDEVQRSPMAAAAAATGGGGGYGQRAPLLTHLTISFARHWLCDRRLACAMAG